MTVNVGDIWEYSYPQYGTATLLVLQYVEDGNNPYYMCLKLENGEVGDWCIDLHNQYENSKWRWLA